jgi:Ca2+-binding EF-hand superfamily protein
MTSKIIEDIIKEVDENGDGQIQFEEFVHMMKKLVI